jgi:hypothetical protein
MAPTADWLYHDDPPAARLWPGGSFLVGGWCGETMFRAAGFRRSPRGPVVTPAAG